MATFRHVNFGCDATSAEEVNVCPPTLEALVAMCYGEGALLHGQLVKFGELLRRGKERT